MEEKNKQDVMISNLPLLFSDGKPISLVVMKVVSFCYLLAYVSTEDDGIHFCIQEDLQYFLPFLLKCILGCEPSGWVRYPKFKWWPSDVPWSPIILTKKYQTQVRFTKHLSLSFSFSILIFFCSIGKKSFEPWWGIAMNIMDVHTCSSFQQSSKHLVEATDLRTTGMEQHQCMTAHLESC